MSERQKNILKSSLGVAGATLLSRLLGMVRVMLEAAVLGGGTVASGWGLAFMVPNLFRRLLGEGALGTALIPLIVRTEAQKGITQVRRDLGQVFMMLSALLAAIVVVVSLGAWLCRPLFHSEHARLAVSLLPLLMPYAFFICLIGVIGAILNSRRVFLLPALGALLLNLFLIAGLALWQWQGRGMTDLPCLLERLAVLTLASGAVQLGLFLFLLHRKGGLPLFRQQGQRDPGVLKELWRLVLPGMIAYSALQISFLADRVIAAWIGPMAVPALNYTDRIIDLPIGIFAVALGSVLMPALSRAAAGNDYAAMRSDIAFGLRLVGFICIPAAVFVMCCWQMIATLLFFRGNFTSENLQAMAGTMVFYGSGLPFFCSLKVLLPAFYSRKDMRRPLYVSLGCVTLNIVLNLLLMKPLEQGGIALATVISSVCNNLSLLLLLRHDRLLPACRDWCGSLVRSLAAAVAAILVVSLVLESQWGPGALWGELLLSAVLFGVIYLLVHGVSGGREWREVWNSLRRRGRKSQGVESI